MQNPGSPGFAMPDDENTQNRKIRDAERTARENAAARSLAASQIGAGGLLVNGGGSITIADGGSLNVASGALNSGGSISAGTTIKAGTTITAGGKVTAGTGVDANGPITGTTVAASGAVSGASITTTGNAAISGALTATVGLGSSGARANVLTSWIAAQLDPAGNIGIVSSSVNVKQDFAPVSMAEEMQGLYRAGLIEFTEHRGLAIVTTNGHNLLQT